MTEYNNVDLFGGAIVVSLPSTFTDVSTIRPVPDNQEVYLDAEGFASVVFDILERVDKPDAEAMQLHLSDVVEEDADETRVWVNGPAHFVNLPAETPTYTLVATAPPGAKQKGRPNEPDFVGVLMTLVRLEELRTDIVVSINVPHLTGQYDAANVDFEAGKLGSSMERALAWREKIFETLQVKDWGLFGEG